MEPQKSSKSKIVAAVIIIALIVGVILAVTLPTKASTRMVVAAVFCLISFIAGRLSNR